MVFQMPVDIDQMIVDAKAERLQMAKFKINQYVPYLIDIFIIGLKARGYFKV